MNKIDPAVIQKTVVVGPNDFSSASCRLLLAHTNASSYTPIELSPSPDALFGQGPALQFFNQGEVTYLVINANLSVQQANVLASEVTQLFSSAKVEKVVIPAALHFQFNAKKSIYKIQPFQDSASSDTDFPLDTPIPDDFIAVLLTLLRLENIPTTLLFTRGHKFQPGNPLQTQDLIKILGNALQTEIKTFEHELSKVSKLKVNPPKLQTKTPVEDNEADLYT